MLFRDILNLPYDQNSDIIDESALKRALPNVPELVREQVFADHGRKDDFQEQYGNLVLDAISWQEADVAAVDLAAASVHQRYRQWVERVAARFGSYPKNGWSCIDGRPDVVAQWKSHATWLTPPVFICGVGDWPTLHLVEGHSRLGILKGALRTSLIQPHTKHRIWVGRGAI